MNFKWLRIINFFHQLPITVLFSILVIIQLMQYTLVGNRENVKNRRKNEKNFVQTEEISFTNSSFFFSTFFLLFISWRSTSLFLSCKISTVCVSVLLVVAATRAAAYSHRTRTCFLLHYIIMCNALLFWDQARVFPYKPEAKWSRCSAKQSCKKL